MPTWRVFQRMGRTAAHSAVLLYAALMTACTSLVLPDNAPTLTQFPADQATELAQDGSPLESPLGSPLVVSTQATDQPTNPLIAQPTAPITLRVWLPEPLAPIENETAAELLSEQISDFLNGNPDVLMDLRLKRPSEVGGILSTLRAASIVAPDALPDLTLMRRADLVAAVQGGYLETLDDRLPVGFFDDFDARVSDLGRLEDRQYGIPFTIDLLHTAFNPAQFQIDTWTFDVLLADQIPFVFPANRSGTLSDTVMVQLTAAGMRIDPAGAFDLDPTALRALFTYYERAVDDGLLSPNVLTYLDPSAYTDMILSGDAVGVITARQYRQLIAQGEPLTAGYIPTLDGAPITLLDGWMWVLVTADSRRQEVAARFLTWMFDAERQQAYTDATGAIPSQQSARRLWEDAAYAEFLDTLLPNAIYPPDPNSAAAARLVQTELAAVINGEESTSGAVQSLIAQLTRP